MNLPIFSFSSDVKKGLAYVLELGGVYMRSVQLQAHLCKLPGILLHLFRIVSRSAGIGFLAKDAVEADAVSAIFRYYVFTRFRRGNAHIINLAGQQHLVQRLLNFAREIQFEHEGRV